MFHVKQFEGSPLLREITENQRRLQIISDLQLPKPQRTRVFTISNQKGGVGKTTSTVNLAVALASKGMNVVVIDLDPQGNASTALNIPHHGGTRGIYNVLTENVALASVLAPSSEAPNLFVAPATLDLAGAEIEIITGLGQENWNGLLKQALDEYIATAPQRPDYIFIDCPPSLGLLTVNAFVAAREVLIPIQCEYYALEGVTQLMDTIGRVQRFLNPDLELSTVLLTMFDNRTKLAVGVVENVREHFAAQVLDTIIPRSVRVSEAPGYAQTVINYDRTNQGAIAYLEAAAEIAIRGAQNGR
jgi:chromosome partitioning protein